MMATSTDAVDQVETILMCSICIETLTEPRTLPCHHTFCKICLTKYVKAQREKSVDKKIQLFNCPECRSEFSLESEEQVEVMGSSHLIRNMLEVVAIQREMKENVTKCSLCDQHAICRCSTCEKFMCERCSQAHEIWHNGKKHSVLSLSDLGRPENEVKLKPTLYCKKHENKAMKFFCETCQELICRYCMDFDHVRPEHLCYPMVDVAEKQRQCLKSHCDNLQQQLHDGEETLKVFSNIEKSWEDNAKKAKDEIVQQKEEILKAFAEELEKNAKLLMNKVDEKYKETKEDLAKDKTKVKDYMNKVKGSFDLAKNLFEKGNDEEILSSQKLINENVEKLKELPDVKDMKPVQDGHIGYEKNEVINDDITKLIEKLGKIECHPVKVHCELILCDTSTILSKHPEYAQQLQEWLGNQFKWRCSYRASTHGWRAEDFNKNCDNVGPTVTLVKVDDYIFGGYTDQNWAGDQFGLGKYEQSQSSFLFSLRNKDGLPCFKAPIKPDQYQYAINCHPSYGPTFGVGDLRISNNSNTNQDSYTNFGHTYQPPAGYVYNNNQTRSLFAGSYQFTPCEVEVFY